VRGLPAKIAILKIGEVSFSEGGYEPVLDLETSNLETLKTGDTSPHNPPVFKFLHGNIGG
jgi:hypothetical protein